MSGCGCGRGGGGGREPVKIVVINTHYVETDEKSFKSVVQELTGKDSGVAMSNNNTVPSKSRKVRPCNGMKIEEGIIHQSATATGGINVKGRSNSFPRKDLSFKDFDKLLEEMPPVDELFNGLWADH